MIVFKPDRDCRFLVIVPLIELGTAKITDPIDLCRIEKLVETINLRIFRVGLAKAEDMENAGEKVFKWAPEL